MEERDQLVVRPVGAGQEDTKSVFDRVLGWNRHDDGTLELSFLPENRPKIVKAVNDLRWSLVDDEEVPTVGKVGMGIWGAKPANGKPAVAARPLSTLRHGGKVTDRFEIPKITKKVQEKPTSSVNGKPHAEKIAKRESISRLTVPVTQSISIPASVRPHILGKGGANLRAPTARTLTNIQIPRERGDENIPVTDELQEDEPEQEVIITGDFEGVKQARKEVEGIVAQRTSKHTIRVNAAPGARIHIPPMVASSSDENLNEILLVGERAAVLDAEDRVKAIYDEVATRKLAIRKRLHPFILDGSTCQEILNKTGCHVAGPLSADPSEMITILGPDSMLSTAVQLVLEKSNAVLTEDIDVGSLLPHTTDPQHILRYLYTEDWIVLKMIECAYRCTIHQQTSAAGTPILEILARSKAELDAARLALYNQLKKILWDLHRFVVDSALEIERAKIRDRAIGEAPETTIGSSSLEKFEELERERERIRSEGIPEVQDVRPVDLTKFEALEKEREMIRSKGIVDGPETTIGTSKLSKLEELERKRESIQSGKVQDVVDTGFSVNLSKLKELEKQREKIRAQGNQEGTEISMRVNLQRLEELERERERIRLNEGKATDVAPAVDLRKLEELEAERARIRLQNTREAPVNTIGALNLSKFEQLERERERIRLSQTVNDNTGIVRKTSTNLLKAPDQHLSRTDDSIEQKLTPEEGNSERWEKDPEKMHSPRTLDVATPAPTVALAKLEQLEREREKIRMGASREAPINTIGALNLSKFESQACELVEKVKEAVIAEASVQELAAGAKRSLAQSASKEANGPRPPKRARQTSHSESPENVGTTTRVAVSEGTGQPPEDENGKAPGVEKAAVDLSESGRKATKRMRESIGSEVGSIIEHAAESIIEHAAESAVEDATNPVESMNITGAVEDSRDGMELNKTQGTETVGHGIDDSSKEDAVAKRGDVRVADDSTAGANWLFQSADESLLWPLEMPSVTPPDSESDSDGSARPQVPKWTKGDRLRRALQKTALMDPDAIFAGARPPMEELFREGFPSKRVPPSECPSTHPAQPIVSERDLHQIKWRRCMLRLLELDEMRRALAKMRRMMEKPRNRLLRSLEEARTAPDVDESENVVKKKISLIKRSL
ncbi:hypothetical protein HK104_008976 [Borealophlyctis nickersoniae]|nr:hypothetical protein HK104_008976 [Borealophlyctis nickersoniae]